MADSLELTVRGETCTNRRETGDRNAIQAKERRLDHGRQEA